MNLILASGHQERWNENNDSEYKIKQLIEVNGEILIERIQKQFKSIVITINNDIMKHSDSVFIPEKYEWTIETLLSTLKLWKNQVVILLGDVYYTDNCVKIIESFAGEIMFFGNNDEIFAISFNDHEKVERCLSAILIRNVFDGRLWQLYRNYHGLNRAIHKITDDFTFITDETQDFDTIEEYNTFIKKN